MIGILIFAFIGGAVATVNPCGFALLPAYLARRINSNPCNNNATAVVRAIGVGAMTSGGFMIIFGAAGVVISLGSYWIIEYLPWAGFIIGLILIITGISVISGRRISLRLPVFGGQIPARAWRGDLLFGMGYGTASLSCTLPIFLSVTGMAITGGVGGSALTFIAYTLGMATVLMVLAITVALARHGLALRAGKTSLYSNWFGGGIMALSGAYVTFYWGVILFLPDIPGATRLITYGDIIASPIRSWLGGQTGIIFMLSLALLIFSFLVWASWSYFIRKSKAIQSPKTTLPI